MGAEAVVVLNPKLIDSIAFLRKTSMQLGSKMRFMSAQIIALVEGDLWSRNAKHANAMAAKLDAGLRAMGVEIPNPTQANAVFPIFTEEQTAKLQEHYRFYVWNVATGQVRLMCAWDTTEADVDGFLEVARGIL
jgi:threonine aldolase